MRPQRRKKESGIKVDESAYKTGNISKTRYAAIHFESGTFFLSCATDCEPLPLSACQIAPASGVPISSRIHFSKRRGASRRPFPLTAVKKVEERTDRSWRLVLVSDFKTGHSACTES
jgi:hypothetical protein